jgi:hypothetical protein
MITRFQIFEKEWDIHGFPIKKVVYYTQSFIDENKVHRIKDVINPDWIKNNPVAFEVYKGKLYLTEGHHRFEACLRLNDKEILKFLFDSALYYNTRYQPKSYKKKVINENLKDIDPFRIL